MNLILVIDLLSSRKYYNQHLISRKGVVDEEIKKKVEFEEDHKEVDKQLNSHSLSST